MHRTSNRVLRLLAAAVLAIAGCHHAAGAPPISESVDEAPTITVRVVNHSQLDATIYLAHDGVRSRLGTVTAATAGTFTVRRGLLTGGDFALLADPLGSTRTATSERLLVAQGTLFVWTLESDFVHNSVQVQG